MKRLSLYTVSLSALVIAACDPPPPVEVPVPEPTGPRLLTLSPEARANAELGVEVAGPLDARPELRFQGDVRMMPAQQASVVARVRGVVRSVRKRVGDRVTRGETLATIESRELADAKMAYFESEHTLEFARKAITREKDLIAKGITSKEAYQHKEHALEEAQISHAATLQRLKLLGLDETFLHQLKEDLGQDMATYRVRAPGSGEIIEEAVTLGASVAADQELFRIADLRRVSVEINVPVKDIRALKVGLPVEVVCSQAQLEGTGEVTYVGSVADRDTRTIPVRVETDNAAGHWRPGMAARVAIAAEPMALPVAVPAGALHPVDGKEVLFVEKDETTFELRQVQIGHRDERVVEITGGLTAGERVAVKNSFLLKSEWLNREGE